MKNRYATLAWLLLGSPAWAQTVSSLVPARNASAASRATVVSATLVAPAPAAALRVFSAQTGGRKAGSGTVSGNTVTFDPAVDFRAGETVTSSLTGAAPHVWQFVAAATGGTGTFTTASSVDTAPGQTSGSTSTITPADLDGDGDLDVLVPGGFGSLLMWYSNDGTGRLSNPNRSIPTTNIAQNVAVGDIDADGDLDVVAAAARPSQFDIARNDGAGNFTVSALSTSATNTSASGLLLFDADGDADLDLVYYNWNSAAARQIEVRLNNGTGVFGAAMVSAVPTQYGFATIQPADLDQDGDLDLLLCCNSTLNGSNGFAQSFFNNGTGSYTAGAVYPAANYSGGAALGDVDQDGDLDLAVVDYQSASPVRLLLNNGTGVFAAGTTLTSGSGGQRAAFADLDGDGDLDLLMHGVGDFVHLNDGRGNFGAAATVATTGAPNGLAVVDMDNDGDLDLLTIESAANAPLLVRRNTNSTTTATRPHSATAFRCGPNPVASTGQLRVELQAPAAATATLRNALGRLVQRQAFSGQATFLSTNGLCPGVYLLTVQAAAQAPLTQRVVVE
ncbi:T9SS type A sorting domain-containing protein [Hymenobacter convexus]|uniref:T9SS type A sorting domain-containing protein n=1 Tax=Hymenobacter sp. CA1UV-4 TaxID=3063782 RepID=UPI002713DE48|nr:T9SS type A sorting domain-containing protein [Hymenobacter sp. CA1UV-4]MDO7852917.1 T9SS type A sorting domain-containing protein [Hymenobacter sp. CA1UV-4]